jgi:hypothetical protein
MEDSKKVLRRVNDLGACAYLMMHGFKISGKRDKSFLFEVLENDIIDFEDKQLEYLTSEYHRFDSCLMSLKKWNSQNNDY